MKKPGQWLGAALLGACLVTAAACGGDDGPSDTPEADAAPPLFPENYRDTFTMVRDCRSSTSHDFHKIVVWADAAAAGPYVDRDAPIPEGAVILKEEFDIGDTACEDEVVEYAIMKRLAPGEAPEEHLDWFWQDLDADRNVTSTNDSLCWGCHDDCDGDPAAEFDHTCAVP